MARGAISFIEGLGLFYRFSLSLLGGVMLSEARGDIRFIGGGGGGKRIAFISGLLLCETNGLALGKIALRIFRVPLVSKGHPWKSRS